MQQENCQGFVAVTTVLIVATITLTVAVTAAMLGINEMLLGFIASESQEALQLADGCAEEASYRYKRDTAYAGGTIPFVGGTCTVIVSGSGATRTITSTVVLGDYTRSVQTSVTRGTNVSGNAVGVDVTSWSDQ